MFIVLKGTKIIGIMPTEEINVLEVKDELIPDELNLELSNWHYRNGKIIKEEKDIKAQFDKAYKEVFNI